MEEVPRHEQLFVLMDANASTGRRDKRGVRRKDKKLSVSTTKIVSTTSENYCCLSRNNHDLAYVNTFFSTPKGGVPQTFNGRRKKRIDYILTRQSDRKLVGNVTVYPQPSFLPISDHNIVSAPAKPIGRFARNRRLRN